MFEFKFHTTFRMKWKTKTVRTGIIAEVRSRKNWSFESQTGIWFCSCTCTSSESRSQKSYQLFQCLNKSKHLLRRIKAITACFKLWITWKQSSKFWFILCIFLKNQVNIFKWRIFHYTSLGLISWHLHFVNEVDRKGIFIIDGPFSSSERNPRFLQYSMSKQFEYSQRRWPCDGLFPDIRVHSQKLALAEKNWDVFC